MKKTSKPFKLYEKHKIVLNADERWESGNDHHPKSKELVEFMAKIDYEFNDDSCCIKMGGDGDLGETLMYLMDPYFELQDKLNADTILSLFKEATDTVEASTAEKDVSAFRLEYRKDLLKRCREALDKLK